MRLLLLVSIALCTIRAWAAEEDLKIREDTPYVQSGMVVVDTMLEMAGVRPDDFVIDLGSGDGRIVIQAAKRFGARGVGIEYDPQLIQLATENAMRARVGDRVSFLEQNIFSSDFSAASVITMYLLPEYNLALRPKLLAMRPGTRIVSHDFAMGDWKPDARKTVPVPDKPVGVNKESTIYFWIVPARVGGRWKSQLPSTGADAQFTLRQKFQELSGTAVIGGRSVPVERARISGSVLSFRVRDGERTLRFNGQVSAARINGQLGIGDRFYSWHALKAD